MEEPKYWRRCSSCKKEIGFSQKYYVCSVSTCKKSVYCSVDCWDEHVPIMNHKDAWAEEEMSPSRNEFMNREKRRIVVSAPKMESSSQVSSTEIPQDILIVVSKLKAYVKAKHGLNTSADVMPKLSDLVRELVDHAAINAKHSERKTLFERDF